MIIDERESRRERVIEAGRRMMTAARTAPKAKGVDILECCLLTDDDIRRLSEVMLELHEETGRPVYKRDSGNILQADCVLVIATRAQMMGLNCGQARKRAVRVQPYRCRHSDRFGRGHGCRREGRHPCDVLCGYGRGAYGASARLQPVFRHTSVGILQVSVF